MSDISKDDILHLAKLAQIYLSEDEIKPVTNQIGKLIGHFSKIKEANTNGVAPLNHVVTNSTVLRADEVRPSLDQKEALKNASSPQGGYFRVPRIVE